MRGEDMTSIQFAGLYALKPVNLSPNPQGKPKRFEHNLLIKQAVREMRQQYPKATLIGEGGQNYLVRDDEQGKHLTEYNTLQYDATEPYDPDRDGCIYRQHNPNLSAAERKQAREKLERFVADRQNELKTMEIEYAASVRPKDMLSPYEIKRINIQA